MFAHIQDYSGRLQIVLRIGDISKEAFDFFADVIDMGDFVGLEGEIFTTQKGEVSVLVRQYTILSKALLPLPEKWSGIQDTEVKYRKRYLDLISNEDTAQRFKFRSDFLWELRNFYYANGFQEVDTPVLCNTASGALAKPFKTHYNSLDMDVYLRIAPEIFLKQAIIGGYEKIFEVARCFRNEGMDPSHLQEFSMVEHYAAYWDFRDNMAFTEKMLTTIIQKLKGTLEVDIMNRSGELVKVNFAGPWEAISFRDLLIRDCGIDIDAFSEVESLRAEIAKKNIKIKDMQSLGRGNLIDALYKEVSRGKLIGPIFLINHPIDLSPLARKNDANPMITDRFQLVVNGWEIVNAYSELIDPLDQKERFDKQMVARQAGDEEAMLKDDEYVQAMEYGMPPISGWGMGIERIVALLTQQPNLRDVVLFPLLRPKKSEEGQE
jgi:lysyl-tRNA synthetase class 2